MKGKKMADFCKQCSIDLFDEDFGDVKDICTKCGHTIKREE